MSRIFKGMPVFDGGPAEPLYDLLKVPAHLRPGGACWPVANTGMETACARCHGSGLLPITDGTEVDCPDCDATGSAWVDHHVTTDKAAVIGHLHVEVDGHGAKWVPRWVDLLSFLRFEFLAGDLFATREEAQAECDRRNGGAG